MDEETNKKGQKDLRDSKIKGADQVGFEDSKASENDSKIKA